MSDPERSVSLGVLVAPGLPEEVSTRIADDLAEDLREAHGVGKRAFDEACDLIQRHRTLFGEQPQQAPLFGARLAIAALPRAAARRPWCLA